MQNIIKNVTSWLGKGGTKKIADLPPHNNCRHPEHEPPRMMVFEPGIYEHTCPACGHKTRFVSNSPTL